MLSQSLTGRASDADAVEVVISRRVCILCLFPLKRVPNLFLIHRFTYFTRGFLISSQFLACWQFSGMLRPPADTGFRVYH